jgi:hypothetical protein
VDDVRNGPESSASARVGSGRLSRIDWRPKLRWFAAEIVIVVAGVLIALAINATWAARQQARDERRLLSGLRNEFRANREQLDQLIAFHEQLKATTTRLLIYSADPPASLSPDSVDQLLADASWWSSYTALESTVLDAAVQYGQLNLIESDSLRRILTTWRSEVGLAAAQSEQELAHYQNVWLPLLREQAELGQISNRATVVPGTNIPYQGALLPLPILRTDHRPLVSSRAVRNALVQKVWIEDDVLYQYRQLRPLLSRIIIVLDQELHE